MTKAEVLQLYVAIFNRVPENEGLEFWQKANIGYHELADEILKTQAAKDYFGNTIDSNKAFVELIYKNSLGKDYAKDPEGIDYWVNLIASGASRGVVAAAIADAATNDQNARAKDPQAASTFDAKVALSEYVASKIQKIDATYTLEKMQEFLAGTTKETLEAKKSAVDTFVASNGGGEQPKPQPDPQPQPDPKPNPDQPNPPTPNPNQPNPPTPNPDQPKPPTPNPDQPNPPTPNPDQPKPPTPNPDQPNPPTPNPQPDPEPVPTQTDLTDKNDDNVVGTSSNDTFNAAYYVGSGTKKSTIASTDKVDGKEGTDTLKLAVEYNSGADQTADKLEKAALNGILAGVKNVEKIEIASKTLSSELEIKNFSDVKFVTENSVNIATDATKVEISAKLEAALAANSATDVKVIADSVKKNIETVFIDGKGANVTANAQGAKVVVSATGNSTVNAKNASSVEIDLGIRKKFDNGDIVKQTDKRTLDTTDGYSKAQSIKLSNLKVTSPLKLDSAKNIELKNFDGEIVADQSIVNLNLAATVWSQGKGNVTYTEVTNVASGKTILNSSAADKISTLNLNTSFTQGDILGFGNNVKGLAKLVLTGTAKKLNLDLAAQSKLVNVDASAFTGNLEKLKVANISNSTVKLGSGDDTVVVSSTANTQSIDGGAGSDSIELLNLSGGLGGLTLANFENLKISGALSGTLDAANFAGIDSIVLARGGNGAINNLSSGANISIIENALDGVLSLSGGTSAIDTLNLTIAPEEGETEMDLSGSGIKVDNIKTLNIASKNSDGAYSDTTNALKILAGTNDELTTINIKATNDADSKTITKLSFDSSVQALKTINANSSEGGVETDVSSLANLTNFAGSASVDTIEFSSAGNKNATINGGSGADKFISKDKFNASAAASADDFATLSVGAGDKINIKAKGTLNSFTYASGNDFYTNLKNALVTVSDTDNTVHFNDGANTYVVSDEDGNGATLDDINVVKLAGSVNFGANADASGDVTIA